jgi:hypothetical protein
MAKRVRELPISSRTTSVVVGGQLMWPEGDALCTTPLPLPPSACAMTLPIVRRTVRAGEMIPSVLFDESLPDRVVVRLWRSGSGDFDLKTGAWTPLLPEETVGFESYGVDQNGVFWCNGECVVMGIDRRTRQVVCEIGRVCTNRRVDAADAEDAEFAEIRDVC